MRFRRHLELERGQKEINITPLVDMIFQLLIFFMLTSSFIVVPGIRVNLPRAITSEVIKDQDIVISIDKDNAVYLNDKPVAVAELAGYLEEAAGTKPEKPLLIKADKDTPLGTVVEIWDVCRKAGIAQINIATVQEPMQTK